MVIFHSYVAVYQRVGPIGIGMLPCFAFAGHVDLRAAETQGVRHHTLGKRRVFYQQR